MFQKINSKNMWKIHIIDYLKVLLTEDLDNPLILAGAAIAASAKVYALRVDDVYAQVVKLAAGLAGRRFADEPENTSDQEGRLHMTL